MHTEMNHPIQQRLVQQNPRRPAPVRFVDEHGESCLKVALDPDGVQCAVIYERDYDDLAAAGLTGWWLLNDRGDGRKYVRASVRAKGGGRTLVMIGRMILNAGPGTVVRYANGDRLDLRFHNLAWQRGRSKRSDLEVIANG